MDKFRSLGLLLVWQGLGCVGLAAERPNVVFILADDLGFSDLGCYGGGDCHAAVGCAGGRGVALHAILQHGAVLADARGLDDGILCAGDSS